MTGNKLRQQIVFEAARLMYQRQEHEFGRAKVRAARTLCRQRLRPSQLPTNGEIRIALQGLLSVYQAGPAIPNKTTRFDRSPVDDSRVAFSGIDRSPDETAPGAPAREGSSGVNDPGVLPREMAERFCRYRNLLIPLSKIQQDRKQHPEGDVLYHSLQVFGLARQEIPYDEELLSAALLHDVGKGIDPHDPVEAGLEALGEFISERTAWLIENCSLARNYLKGTIGIRARRRLQNSEDHDELILLAKCDAAGRVPGAPAPEMDEALDYLRGLDAEFE